MQYLNKGEKSSNLYFGLNSYKVTMNKIKCAPVSIYVRNELCKQYFPNYYRTKILLRNRKKCRCILSKLWNNITSSRLNTSVQELYGLAFVSYINFGISLVSFNTYYIAAFALLVLIPQQFLTSCEMITNKTATNNISRIYFPSPDFTLDYDDNNNSTEDENQYYINWLFMILSGGGSLEKSVMFIGVYPPSLLISRYCAYHLVFVYLTVVMLYNILFLFSVCAKSKTTISLSLSKEIVHRKFSQMLFSIWDYSNRNKDSVKAMKQQIYNKLIVDQMNQKQNDIKYVMLSKQRRVIIAKRILINSIIFALFLISIIGTVFLQIYCKNTEFYQEYSEKYSKWMKLLNEFLPSIYLLSIGVITPSIMRFLIRFEEYDIYIKQLVSTVRILTLRLLTILAFWVTNKYIYSNDCDLHITSSCRTKNKTITDICWETKIGQEFYRLNICFFILYFSINFMKVLSAVVFFACLKFIHAKAETYIEIGFIDRNIDLIFLQLICLCGTIYSPLLPILTNMNIGLCLFYNWTICHILRRWAMPNFQSMKIECIVMESFIGSIACITLALIRFLFLSRPSSCGPFQGFESPILAIVNLVKDTCGELLTQYLKEFLVLMIFVISFAINYYYILLSEAYKLLYLRFKNTMEIVIHDKSSPNRHSRDGWEIPISQILCDMNVDEFHQNRMYNYGKEKKEENLENTKHLSATTLRSFKNDYKNEHQ